MVGWIQPWGAVAEKWEEKREYDQGTYLSSSHAVRLPLAASVPHPNFLDSCVSTGSDFAPRDYLQCLETSFVATTRAATGIKQVGANEAAKHSTIHRTAASKQRINQQSINCAKAEKLCSRSVLLKPFIVED